MEGKEVEIVNAQGAVLYTKEELFEDIQTTVEEYVEDTPEDEKDRRDFRHKLKVLQSIFGLHLPSYDLKKDNMDDIKEALEVYVDGNEFLFGYTFFCHQIQTSIIRGITCVSKWTNMLISSLRLISSLVMLL